MKKVIIFLFLIGLLELYSHKETSVTIPKESIRFRIVANSNNMQDQLLKVDIKAELLPILEKVSNAASIEEVRHNIQTNLSSIEQKVSSYTSDYNISFGKNYFPLNLFLITVYIIRFYNLFYLNALYIFLIS